MNKFKRWLIRKLGGFTAQDRMALKVVKSTIPIIRLSEMIAFSDDYLKYITAAELDNLIKEELGRKLGNMLIKENYVDITHERGEADISTIVRGTIYVAKKVD